MEIKAHFANIREHIQHELNGARSEITAAIAWLTDPTLFESLIQASNRGVRVRIALLNDVINRNSGLSMNKLVDAGGKYFWIPEKKRTEGSLHHKFCVIDQRIVINGSYNWTRRASRADENIMIVEGDPKLATGYLKAFETLLEKYGQISPATPSVNSETLQKRLNVILNLLLLEDFATIAQQIPHLKAACEYKNIPDVLDAIERQDWQKAEQCLQTLIANGLALTVYESPEEVELRLALRTLETQIIALTTEQIETEELIDQFSKRQNSIIGDILGEYLHLREQILFVRAMESSNSEDHNTFEDAKEENESYQQSRDPDEKVSPLDSLSKNEQKELKRLFRQASMLCHPDRVPEADKAQAQTVFTQVHKAYKNAELSTLRRIQRNLKDGKLFEDPADMPTEVDQLRKKVARLRLDVERYITSIYALRQSDTFKTLSSIDDWNVHFADAREQLETECENLRTELKQDQHER